MKNGKKLLLIVLMLAVAGLIFLFKNKIFSNGAQALKDCPDCNVVVITIDTFRADRLASFGYDRVITPFLDAFIKRSVLFENAFSASSWTAPATASIFTSLHTSEHGVISGFLATKRMIKDGVPIKMNRIPDQLETLGEMMKKAGYQTIGVADNLNIGKEMGFDRGFDQFEKFGEKGAEKMNRTASDFIDKVKDKGPYFAYLHYMDPHAPYLEMDPWFSKCLRTTDGSNEQRMICAYDSEIKYMDFKLKNMFVKYNWLENSIVFLVADHGEELWDHGERGHGKTLYTELIHVPFAIYHPKWKPQKVTHKVHTMDLLPTLASLLGNPQNPIWRGQDLTEYLRDGFVYQDRLLFSERLRTPFGKLKWWKRSLVDKNMHYILTEEDDNILDQELYNLDDDFAEKNNLASTNPELLKELNAKFSNLPNPDVAQNEDATEIKMDPELIKQLKSLGYID